MPSYQGKQLCQVTLKSVHEEVTYTRHAVLPCLTIVSSYFKIYECMEKFRKLCSGQKQMGACTRAHTYTELPFWSTMSSLLQAGSTKS